MSDGYGVHTHVRLIGKLGSWVHARGERMVLQMDGREWTLMYTWVYAARKVNLILTRLRQS